MSEGLDLARVNEEAQGFTLDKWQPAIDNRLQLRISFDEKARRPLIEWQMHSQNPQDAFELKGFRREGGFPHGNPLEGSGDMNGELFLADARLVGSYYDPLPYQTGVPYFYTFFLERKNPNYLPGASALERMVDTGLRRLLEAQGKDYTSIRVPYQRVGLLRAVVIVPKTERDEQIDEFRSDEEFYRAGTGAELAKGTYEDAKERNEARQKPASNNLVKQYLKRLNEKKEAEAELRARFEAGELSKAEYEEGLRFIENEFGRDGRMKDW